MISFIIPANNEEAWIGRCLITIHSTMREVHQQYEVIVVDDASTDSTPRLAEAQSGRVVHVAHRHIAATRNAGAREASGDIFFFVDADTLINNEVVKAALSALEGGAVGGGCVPSFEGKIPLWWRVGHPFFVAIVRLLKMPGGACQFCTHRAFDASGGFSEAHFAGEDNVFISELKKLGRVVVLDPPIVTSGRNLRAHSFWTIAPLLFLFAFRGADAFRDRKGLNIWYRPHREKGGPF